MGEALTIFHHAACRATRLVAAAIVGAVLTTGAAFAGGCPAGKQVASGSGQAMSDAKAVGVTDTVMASTDLAKVPGGINDRLFRLRKLVVQPGGVVPWHSHDNRPALIYIISGEIVEYASTCAVPIMHKAGESTTDTHPTAHWWKNLGKTPVVLLSSDLFPKAAADDHMM